MTFSEDGSGEVRSGTPCQKPWGRSRGRSRLGAAAGTSHRSAQGPQGQGQVAGGSGARGSGRRRVSDPGQAVPGQACFGQQVYAVPRRSRFCITQVSMPSPSATNSRSRSPRAVGHARAARNGGAPHEGALSQVSSGLGPYRTSGQDFSGTWYRRTGCSTKECV